ncbi:MAG: prephenate dehydrogenase/arogenate dehydrogenase family protein, partial [Pseudomonadota bacterium]
MVHKIEHIAIIGLGLLGGSIGRAVKAYLPHIKVSGYDISEETIERALHIGFIDHGIKSFASDLKDIQAVILCTPLGTFSDLAQQIIPHMSEGAILTDTGSVKQSVIDAIVPLLKDREDIAF